MKKDQKPNKAERKQMRSQSPDGLLGHLKPGTQTRHGQIGKRSINKGGRK